MSGHCEHCSENCHGDPLVKLGARMHRAPDEHAYWDSGFCPVCRFIEAEQAKVEKLRAIAESTPMVTEEWLLADARKVHRWPICDACGQVIFGGET